MRLATTNGTNHANSNALTHGQSQQSNLILSRMLKACNAMAVHIGMVEGCVYVCVSMYDIINYANVEGCRKCN